MATGIQIVFDCENPKRLATFWAAALLYKIQDPPDGFATWEDFLKSIGVPESEYNSASAVVDPEGRGPRIFFQRMPTPKPGKNRLHIDVNASGGRDVPMEEKMRRVDAEVARLEGLGAAKQKEWDEAGERWVVMLDPEGNEFCVQ